MVTRTLVPTRLIIFLELVRGCNNKECPSWGSVCKYDGQHYMELKTISQIAEQLKEVLKDDPFEVVDLWTYGCGDSLDHPEIDKVLKRVRQDLGDSCKISMAIDSRRDILKGTWWTNLSKIKIIHKIPESFDWLSSAKKWSSLPIPMSHKLITNHITNDMWHIWKTSGFIEEMKAVPWHDIALGTDSPVFTKRSKMRFDPELPVVAEAYPGKPVRRMMISYDGSLRRCLISPTSYQTIKKLAFGKEDVCQTCFPLTGGELVKFHDDYISVTPSANCVSDGYYSPIE